MPGTAITVNWAATHVMQLLNDAYLVRRHLPSDMYDAYVIPVYKEKVHPKVMNNCRGITITMSSLIFVLQFYPGLLMLYVQRGGEGLHTV
jgi:hypothetical protein